jgi:hypothetical protein
MYGRSTAAPQLAQASDLMHDSFCLGILAWLRRGGLQPVFLVAPASCRRFFFQSIRNTNLLLVAALTEHRRL